MIAKIRFDRDGEPCEAVLSDDGTWQCPHPPAAEFLNLFHAAHDGSPAEGVHGRRQALAAAEALGGVADFPVEPEDGEDGGDEPAGRVY